MQSIFEYTSPVWYHSLTSQRKIEIHNTGLRKILEAFRSASVKAMHRDAEILLVNIPIKEIRDWLAVTAIRAMRGNHGWNLAGHTNPVEIDFIRHFYRSRKMNGVGDDNQVNSFPGTWSQDSSWRQGPLSSSQVLRFITETILLMCRLIKADCWGFITYISDTVCQSDKCHGNSCLVCMPFWFVISFATYFM